MYDLYLVTEILERFHWLNKRLRCRSNRQTVTVYSEKIGGIDELWQTCAASYQMKMIWVVFSNVSDTRRDLDGGRGNKRDY
jgi:hypothetical protein